MKLHTILHDPACSENELKITYDEFIETDDGYFLWVDLEFNGEARQVCYKVDIDGFYYVDGDKEPDMPETLQDFFYGPAGDAALLEVMPEWDINLANTSKTR